MSLSGPVSPCINVCVLDGQGVCQGCLRTIDEIAGWGRMTAAEQWGVMARLERAQRDLAASRLARGAADF